MNAARLQFVREKIAEAKCAMVEAVVATPDIISDNAPETAHVLNAESVGVNILRQIEGLQHELEKLTQ